MDSNVWVPIVTLFLGWGFSTLDSRRRDQEQHGRTKELDAIRYERERKAAKADWQRQTAVQLMVNLAEAFEIAKVVGFEADQDLRFVPTEHRGRARNYSVDDFSRVQTEAMALSGLLNDAEIMAGVSETFLLLIKVLVPTRTDFNVAYAAALEPYLRLTHRISDYAKGL